MFSRKVYSHALSTHHGFSDKEYFFLLEAEGSLRVRMVRRRRDSTRLETRTKESSVLASQRVLKPEGAVKANCYKTCSLKRHAIVDCKSDLEQVR